MNQPPEDRATDAAAPAREAASIRQVMEGTRWVTRTRNPAVQARTDQAARDADTRRARQAARDALRLSLLMFLRKLLGRH
ncbi:MAG: hypothetical protein RLY71_3863 [Pseudomonadota bacterium]|jgi:hypothetical protein